MLPIVKGARCSERIRAFALSRSAGLVETCGLYSFLLLNYTKIAILIKDVSSSAANFAFPFLLCHDKPAPGATPVFQHRIPTSRRKPHQSTRTRPRGNLCILLHARSHTRHLVPSGRNNDFQRNDAFQNRRLTTNPADQRKSLLAEPILRPGRANSRRV